MKKIIIAAVIVLVFLAVLIALLGSLGKNKKIDVQVSPTPTTAPYNMTPASRELLDSAKALAPYETENFKYEYSPQADKIIVTEKTDAAFEDFAEWSTQNGLPELAGNPEMVVFQNSSPDSGITLYPTTPTPSINPFIEFINVFLDVNPVNNLPAPSIQSKSESTTTKSSSKNETVSKASKTSGKVYYSQCNEYGNTALPSGCNLCQAGCGPTTVSMIASSYVDSKYDPKAIVDMYAKNGYYLSCGGSRYSDAKAALESLGLKTTSYMTYDYAKADEVASDFKKYIDAGWTIFTLASYCDNGCGHYFWVTDVKDGNILAYDPYYGKSSTPPINENSRYPFPKYRVAFGVKK